MIRAIIDLFLNYLTKELRWSFLRILLWLGGNQISPYCKTNQDKINIWIFIHNE